MDFPEDYFSVTSVIVGENPDLYHLYIMGEPQSIGSIYRYKVQLVDNDDDKFIPIEELAAGTRWSLDYSLAERYLGKDGSDISFTSPFLMENRLSMLRLNHVVPGEMINMGKNKPLMFGWKDESAKLKNTIQFTFSKFSI